MTWLRDIGVLLALWTLRLCIQNHEGDYGLNSSTQVMDFCDFGLGVMGAVISRRGIE